MSESISQLFVTAMSSLGFTLVLVTAFWLSGQSWVRSHSILLANLLLAPGATVITTVIRNDIALSLGMVGALSIVRFRNPVRSPAELSLYFASLVIGIAATVDRMYPLVVLAVAAVAIAGSSIVVNVFGRFGSTSTSWERGGFLLHATNVAVDARMLESRAFTVVHIESQADGLNVTLRCPTMEAALSARDQLANGDERQAQSWSISLIE